MVPRTNSSYLLQRIESAETYKCVREAEMKGKEKLSVPFGSQLIGLISKAYLYELCLKHKDILRHGTLSVTRTLDRYQLQIPLKYYTYILLRKEINISFSLFYFVEIMDNRREEKGNILLIFYIFPKLSMLQTAHLRRSNNTKMYQNFRFFFLNLFSREYDFEMN